MARARASLLSPFHVAALATGAKSFRDNPIIGSARLNRRGLHVARMRIAARMAAARRARLAELVAAEDREAFARDGYIEKRDFLPSETFAALRDEVLERAAPARDMVQGDTVTRRIAVDAALLRDRPHLRGLGGNPAWLGLIRYVGASALEPLVYIQTIFSHVRPGAPDPQTRFHADTFHSSVKAWLFLTDVAADGGPLVYVPGSHILTPRRLAWEKRVSIRAAASADYQSSRGSPRIAPSELGHLGCRDPHVFAVPANTLVVADTLGFHARGPSARPTARVEMFAYGRRNPFLPWLGFDPARLPGVRGRAVPLFWHAGDTAERIGLGRNPWQP
ncbi:MAG: phytanoyl-CoA dioxygenase family protein, partial [Stellaceae bacterium]